MNSVQFMSDSLQPHESHHPGLPVHHQLPELTRTHVHRVGDAIQPSHPLSSPFPLAPNPSQHQGLCQWVNSLHEVAKVVEFQLQHQSYWKNKHNLTQMASHFRQQAFSTKIKKKKLKLDKKVVHSFNYLLSPVFPVYNIRNFSFVELTMWSINGKLL